VSVCHICSAHPCLRVSSYTSGLVSVSPSQVPQPIWAAELGIVFCKGTLSFGVISKFLQSVGQGCPSIPLGLSCW